MWGDPGQCGWHYFQGRCPELWGRGWRELKQHRQVTVCVYSFLSALASEVTHSTASSCCSFQLLPLKLSHNDGLKAGITKKKKNSEKQNNRNKTKLKQNPFSSKLLFVRAFYSSDGNKSETVAKIEMEQRQRARLDRTTDHGLKKTRPMRIVRQNPRQRTRTPVFPSCIWKQNEQSRTAVGSRDGNQTQHLRREQNFEKQRLSGWPASISPQSYTQMPTDLSGQQPSSRPALMLS